MYDQHEKLPSAKSLVIFTIVSLLIAHVVARVMHYVKERQVTTQFERLRELISGKKTRKPLPITIITGYLGAGKTTLCNNLLSGDHGKKLAVIVNELGKVSIDHELLQSNIGDENVFVLKNGCMCCTTGSTSGLEETSRILKTIYDLVGKNAIDHIIIETSGAANPEPLVQMIYELQLDSGMLEIDSVVTMVDSKHILLHKDEAEPIAQLQPADTIILNKIDLVDKQQLDNVYQFIRTLNPSAHIIQSKNSVVPMHLLHQQAYSLGGLSQRRDALLKPLSTSEHQHLKGLSAVCLTCIGEKLDWDRFDNWIGKLVQEKWKDLYRIKGILQFHGKERETVLQGVHADIQAGPGKMIKLEKLLKPNSVSKLVLIGLGLNQSELEKQFQQLIYTEK